MENDLIEELEILSSSPKHKEEAISDSIFTALATWKEASTEYEKATLKELIRILLSRLELPSAEIIPIKGSNAKK